MAFAVEMVMAGLTLGGLVYTLLALWAARRFAHHLRRGQGGQGGTFAPDVTILKPMKGVDERMYAGIASHCRQEYAGRYELIFGVSAADDPAVEELERLRAEFPEVAMRTVVCPERLGTSGKVSNLVQMLREARTVAGEDAQAGVLDLQPSGFTALRPALEMAIRLAHEQGLISKRPTVDELYGSVAAALAGEENAR